MASSELRAEHLSATAVSPQSPAGPGAKVAEKFSVYSPTGISSQKNAMTLSASRDSMKNGSFLRALLVIAAVSLAVAAPVMGIGVLIALVDFGPLRRPRKGNHRSRK
jgi:hypothetical protein